VVGPLLTSLPKVESSGGDDGPTAAAGTNIGVNVDHLPVLAVAPDGTQHIIQDWRQVAASSTQLMGVDGVDSSILTSAIQQMNSNDGDL